MDERDRDRGLERVVDVVDVLDEDVPEDVAVNVETLRARVPCALLPWLSDGSGACDPRVNRAAATRACDRRERSLRMYPGISAKRNRSFFTFGHLAKNFQWFFLVFHWRVLRRPGFFFPMLVGTRWLFVVARKINERHFLGYFQINQHSASYAKVASEADDRNEGHTNTCSIPLLFWWV